MRVVIWCYYYFFMVCALFHYTIAQEKIKCNGHEELCDRRYNYVSYPTAHNATANQGPTLKTGKAISVQNQSLSVTEQLRRGIRGMKLPLHPVDGVTVCHGLYMSDFNQKVGKKLETLPTVVKSGVKPPLDLVKAGLERNQCYVDPAAVPLVNVLKEIKAFMDRNPHEVITLFLEEDTQTLKHKEIYKSFEQAGLLPYLYTQDKEKLWPTLGEMIKSGKRLVVFIHYKDKEDFYPWLHQNSDYIWETQFEFGDAEALRNNTQIRRNKNYNDAKFVSVWKLHNKVSIVQHFITPSAKGISFKLPILLGGDKEAAKVVNKYDFLKNRLDKLRKATDHRILNFIWVDFIEEGDVFSAVKYLNGIK